MMMMKSKNRKSSKKGGKKLYFPATTKTKIKLKHETKNKRE